MFANSSSKNISTSRKHSKYSKFFHKIIKRKGEGKGKKTLRGVWAPVMIRGGSSFVIYDAPNTDMLLHEWIPREEEEFITRHRNYVDRYKLRKSSSDDTDQTVGSSDDEDKLTRLSIKRRAKALPRGPGAFGSNHVLINRERVIRSIQPLCRDKHLDELAANHAKNVAMREKMEHSCLKKTMNGILANGPARLIGENISKGERPQDIHDEMMLKYPQERNNILDRRFTSFGVGSAKSNSGVLYIVQIYKG